MASRGQMAHCTLQDKVLAVFNSGSANTGQLFEATIQKILFEYEQVLVKWEFNGKYCEELDYKACHVHFDNVFQLDKEPCSEPAPTVDDTPSFFGGIAPPVHN